MTVDSPTRINPMIRHRAGHIGRAVPRREDRSSLLGRQRYIADLKLPGMLEVAFVRSPEAHARIVSIDKGPALDLPGVHAVFTGADLADVGSFPHKILYIQPVGQRPLAVDRVRYVGSPYAAVVATDRYMAEDAATLVAAHTEFDPLPTVADLDQALAGDAPRLYDDWPDNFLVNFPAENPEVTQAFEKSDHTFSDTYVSQRQTGLPLECRGVLADEVDGHLTVWSSTQSPHIVRTTLAEMTGIPEPRIRVISPAMGGGFGTKTHQYPEDIVVPWIARRLGRPVRWLEDRFENLVVLRTFSKAMSMAGLRVGYLLGCPELVEQVAKAKLPYNLNVFSMAAASAALEHFSLLKPQIEQVIAERDRLWEGLSRISGVEPFPSRANFMVFRLATDPGVVFRALCEEGILVRDVSRYPMLQQFLRVSVGLPQENERFLEALSRIMKSQSAVIPA
jgi:hypothetical protein